VKGIDKVNNRCLTNKRLLMYRKYTPIKKILVIRSKKEVSLCKEALQANKEENFTLS
jgi:hypothetical protein